MKITKGYKATNKNMQCKGVQFALGEWQEVEGDLIECRNGFHFCTELAHTWEFYTEITDRRFECEVEDVLDIKEQPGVVFKRVARRIRLTKELIFTGNLNTGDLNTGNLNTGDWNTGEKNTGELNTGEKNTGNKNTGNLNTGEKNTGNLNTGNLNTGNLNTGNKNTGEKNTGELNTGNKNTGNLNTGEKNTGNKNTGDLNTGYWNTGYKNNGDRNTGDLNTGYRNTGNWNNGNLNTGYWNYCNNNAGFFGSIDPKITSFDIECEYTRAEFIYNFGNICQDLHNLMQKEDNPIDVTRFAKIPNITQDRLNNLHQKYINNRSNSNP